MKNKAKVGDLIVITNKDRTSLPSIQRHEAVVIGVGSYRVFIRALDVYDRASIGDQYYVLEDCYELSEVVNSPLWVALK
jgi:hypothetical protein